MSFESAGPLTILPLSDRNGLSAPFPVVVRSEGICSAWCRAEQPLPIIPGMVVSVEILTSENAVLDYLLKPARLPRDEPLREH